MTPNPAEALAKDITAKIGVRTYVLTDTDDATAGAEDGDGSLPVVQIASRISSCQDPFTFEACHDDGVFTQERYGIDRIPIDYEFAFIIMGASEEEVEDIAAALRTTYSTDSPRSKFLVPINETGTSRVAQCVVKQLRTPVEKDNERFMTMIMPAENSYISIPFPYPPVSLRSSLSDRDAMMKLLFAFQYYVVLLETDIPDVIAKWYPKLFEVKKGKIAGAKKSLFGKLRETGVASKVLDNNIVQGLSGENIGKLADAVAAGTLTEEQFEEFFRLPMIIVPDLYERVLHHEPAESVLADANATIAEMQRRADEIANSLGIEEQSTSTEHYKPRSSEGAEVYIAAMAQSENMAMPNAIEAYKSAAAESKAKQDALAGAIAAGVIGTVVGGIGAAIAGGASSGSSSRETGKVDLLGSAGCAKTKGGANGCYNCNLRSECSRA